MNKQNLPGYIKAIVFIMAVYFGWQVLILARSILIPVIMAMLIAIALFPLQVFFEKRLSMSKGISAFLCVLIVLLFFFLFLFFLADEASSFSTDLVSLDHKISGATGQFQNWFHTSNTQLNAYVSKTINSFVGFFSSFMVSIVMSFSKMFIWFILMLVYIFFFLYYRKLLYNSAIQILKQENKEQVESSIQSIRGLTKHFVLGILIEMVVVAILNGILLTVFGIKHSFMIALLAAVLNIIPYIGIYSATLLSILITYANSNSTAAIIAGLILLSVHIVDANFLMPKIMGSQVKLNSFATLVAVIVGGIIWGIPGMFLFIPLVAITRIVLEKIPSCKALVMLLGIDEGPETKTLLRL